MHEFQNSIVPKQTLLLIPSATNLLKYPGIPVKVVSLTTSGNTFHFPSFLSSLYKSLFIANLMPANVDVLVKQRDTFFVPLGLKILSHTEINNQKSVIIQEDKSSKGKVELHSVVRAREEQYQPSEATQGQWREAAVQGPDTRGSGATGPKGKERDSRRGSSREAANQLGFGRFPWILN